ncbi:MAG: hypothetical protein LBE18_06170 [Planctomycetaceae bacterium]|jgi:hypothetical protein|nr:hypothetical protein [Planctomycetaceae bacterium]
MKTTKNIQLEQIFVNEINFSFEVLSCNSTNLTNVKIGKTGGGGQNR